MPSSFCKEVRYRSSSHCFQTSIWGRQTHDFSYSRRIYQDRYFILLKCHYRAAAHKWVEAVISRQLSSEYYKAVLSRAIYVPAPGANGPSCSSSRGAYSHRSNGWATKTRPRCRTSVCWILNRLFSVSVKRIIWEMLSRVEWGLSLEEFQETAPCLTRIFGIRPVRAV